MKFFRGILLALLAVCLIQPLSADELIRAAQAKLKSLGLYDGTVDGQPGSQTSAAIRRYQIYNKLKVTGELNSQTVNQLGISPAAAQKASDFSAKPVVQNSRAVSLAALFAGGPLITAGPEIQVQIIKKAKENLQVLGFYHGPINEDPSVELVEALKAWQRSAKFKTSGRFDKTTLRALDLYEPAHDDGTY